MDLRPKTRCASTWQAATSIFDAGCGLGYKAAWFARLAPHALVIGMDYSDAARQAAQNYDDAGQPVLRARRHRAHRPARWECRLRQLRPGDHAHREPRSGRSANWRASRVAPTRRSPVTSTPRRRCRANCSTTTSARSARPSRPRRCGQMSEQLTELGQRLSALNVSFDAPAIPAARHQGGALRPTAFHLLELPEVLLERGPRAAKPRS